MKIKSKLIISLIIIIMGFTIIYSNQIKCEEISDFEYSINDDEINIVKYSGSDKEIVIPEYIEGKKVVSILEEAFSYRETKNSNIERIKIPKTVRSIDANAIDLYNLKDIVVDPNNKFYCSINGALYSKDKTILIKYPAFRTEIEIPESVTEIEDNACKGCRYVNKVTLPINLKCIGKRAFAFCGKLKEIEIPNSVKIIEEGAFFQDYFTTITIPKGIEYIGENSIDSFIIIGENSSVIRKYAYENKIIFIAFTKQFIFIYTIELIIYAVLLKWMLLLRQNKSII